tara:strand:+ start:61 stop:1398 length:1338 start_codon:yes stop_codon:yes gene_type:complete
MANTYISRSNASGTSTQKGTISVWIKSSEEPNGNNQTTLASWGDANNHGALLWNGSDKIDAFDYQSGYASQLQTNALLRDCSAWYHIVYSWDTTLSTANDRQKIYINGIEQTYSTRTNYSSGATTSWNANSYSMRVGALNSSSYFRGSMSHIHFIDGIQYPATTFGETDATTGQWKIKTSPSVTYGTNGFSILKDGNTITDQSSNSNDFSLGAGTLTKTEDCPSNVFATLNTLDGMSMASGCTFSNGNTSVVCASNNYTPYGTTIGVNKGKWYAEFKAKANMGDGMVGVFANLGDTGYALTRPANSYAWYNASGGNVKTNNANMTGGASVGTYATNDIIQIALDLDNNKLHFNKNNTGWLYSGNPATNAGGYAITDPDSTELGFYFMTAIDWGGGVRGNWECNFGNGHFGTTAVASAGTNASGNGIFEYDVPTGYTALSTKGLNL